MKRETGQQLNLNDSRRQFLTRSALALAGVTAGTVTLSACSSSIGTEVSPMIAAFGWETANLFDRSAAVYFKVLTDVIVTSFAIDVTVKIPSRTTVGKFAAVLCQGSCSRRIEPVPLFAPSASLDFGSVTTHNPNSLGIVCSPSLLQDVFYSVILRTWAPASGKKSETSRQVSAEPLLPLNRGDYLIFDMTHSGAVGDATMQVMLNYG